MSKIAKLLLVFVLCLYPMQALAQVAQYKLVKEKSFLKFFAIQNNAPIEGRFKDFTADIRFDPDKVEQSSLSAEVPIASIEMSNEDVLKNITLPEWLSADLFPKATFVSTKFFRMPSSNNYIVNGDLTIRGKKVPAVLNFRMEHFDSKNAVASGYISIQRKDFNIGQGEWSRDDVIKNEVRIEFRIAAEKQ